MSEPAPQLLIDFEKYDPVQLLSAFAGLSLHPPNADHVLRLETSAAIAASLSRSRMKRRLRLHQIPALVEAVVRCDPDLANREDPFDGPIVEGCTVCGIACKLLPGLSPEDVFTVRKLSAALLNPQHSEDLEAIRRLLVAVATLSTLLIDRARLPLAASPQPSESGSINLPPAEVYGLLSRAVRIRLRDLEQSLAPHNISTAALEPLIQQLGCLPPSLDPQVGSIVHRPLVLAGDWIVVAAPHALLRATLLHLAALPSAVRTQLGQLFHRSCQAWLETHVHRIAGSRPGKLPDPTGDDGWLLTAWGTEFDREKVTYVALLTEAGDQPPSPDPLHTVLSNCLRQVEKADVLLIVLYQRLFSPLCIPRPLLQGLGHAQLSFSLHDADVLCHLPDVDEFYLWRYAEALDRFSGVLLLDGAGLALDTFAFYCENGGKFYASDDVQPTSIAIAPCFASKLRTQTANRLQRHGAQPFGFPQAVEVFANEDGVRKNQYFCIEPGSMCHWRMIEVEDLQMWVETGPAHGDQSRATMADAVLFWLGEIAPEIAQSTCAHESLTITLISVDGCSVLDKTPIVAVRDGQRIALRLPSSEYFAHTDNRGERELARVLCEVLLPAVTKHHLDRIVETIAPLGAKRVIHPFVSLETPELLPNGLPRARLLSGQQGDVLLAEIGQWLTAAQPPVLPTKLLNSTVKFAFERLRSIVGSLCPAGLLEFLIAQHEAVIQRTEWLLSTLPSQRACAADPEVVLATAGETLSRLWTTSIAQRFLIEYVAAKPPVGTTQLGLYIFDDLVATASTVAEYGMLSDLMHRDLADLKPVMLRSGRLGLDHARLSTIHRDVVTRHVQGQATKTDALPNLLDAGAERLTWLDELNCLLTAAVGYSLTDYLKMSQHLIEVGIGSSNSVAKMLLEDLVEGLVARLGWTHKKACATIRASSLGPRQDFWSADDGQENQVRPWRFNRELSYLRRPLLCREEDGRKIVLWGPRNVARSRNQLMNLILEDRLRTDDPALRICLTRIASKEHKRFNDEVADWFESQEFVVRRQVKRIDGLLIAHSPGEELGDIDVIVVDSRKRSVLLVECKDLHIALTPHDIASQLEELKEKLARHRRRVEWVSANREALARELQIAPGQLTIRAIVLTDGPLVSQAHGVLPLPVLAFNEIRIRPDRGWLEARVIGTEGTT